MHVAGLLPTLSVVATTIKVGVTGVGTMVDVAAAASLDFFGSSGDSE